MIPFAKYVRDCFDYDPDTGVLRWKPDRPASHFRTEVGRKVWRTQFAGKVAGSRRPDGYEAVRIGAYSNLRVHRIACLIVNGEWIHGEVDHINGVKYDNRWSNLRVVSRMENMRNAPVRKDTPFGVRGVYQATKGGFEARIGMNGKMLQLGVFETVKEAIAARLAAEVVLGYHENHGRDETQQLERISKC